MPGATDTLAIGSVTMRIRYTTPGQRPTLALAFALCLQAASAADLTIVAVEQSTDTAAETNHEQNKRGLPAGAVLVTVSSLTDANTKILGKIGANDCIKHLHFRGHGAAGVQGVGDGVKWSDDKEIDTGAAQWKTGLAGLKAKFCADAVIHLWGCHVGSCDKGATKLKEIADEFNVTVRGAVDLVTAGGQETYTGAIQEARPNQPKPAHKTAKDEKAPKKKEQKCDVNYDGDVDRSDIDAIFIARGTLTPLGDRRDTDNDGIITVNDARRCAQTCTRPRCEP